jgi:hypothetical protein
MSVFVLAKTCLKQEEQNRLEFENALRGFGISKHFSPLLIGDPQPRQGDCFPATALTGTPAEPLINDGILFFDILELLNFTRQVVQNFREADYSDPEFLRRPGGPLSARTEALIQLLVYQLKRCNKIILCPDVGFQPSGNFNTCGKKGASIQ